MAHATPPSARAQDTTPCVAQPKQPQDATAPGRSSQQAAGALSPCRQPDQQQQHQQQPQHASQPESQLVQQGNVLTPRVGSQLWYALYFGNMPTGWWYDPSHTSSSSSDLATWSDTCRNSSVIQQTFRFSHSAYNARLYALRMPRQGDHHSQQQQEADGEEEAAPLLRARADVNRRAYVLNLHRQSSFTCRPASRIRAAYAHRQAEKARRCQEAALISSWRHQQCMPSQQQAGSGDVPQQEQQQQQAQRRRRVPLPQQKPVSRQQWGSSHQACSAQAQVQAYGPSWQQLCLLRQRRCRLRSHGSVAAAAFLKQRAAASSKIDVSGQGLRASSEVGEFTQLHGSAPCEDVDMQAAAAAAGVRTCIAGRDEHGNLVPLPAGCTAGVCTSKASSSSSVNSMCVAGIGCDHAALAAEAKRARLAARQLAALWESGRRRRTLWTLGWLWGSRTLTPATAAAADSAETVPNALAAPRAAEGGTQQPLPGGALDSSSSGSSSGSSGGGDGSSGHDPRTKVVTVGWDVAIVDDPQADRLMPGFIFSRQVTYPAADAPAGSSTYSSPHEEPYSSSSYSSYSPSAYSESEMSEDAYSSDDDEYDPSYSDSDADSDDDGITLVRAGEQQDTRHIFRNERNVVYGFWRLCPVG